MAGAGGSLMVPVGVGGECGVDINTVGLPIHPQGSHTHKWVFGHLHKKTLCNLVHHVWSVGLYNLYHSHTRTHTRSMSQVMTIDMGLKSFYINHFLITPFQIPFISFV